MWNDKNKIFDRHQCFLPSFLFGLLSLQNKNVPALLSIVCSYEGSSAQDCPFCGNASETTLARCPFAIACKSHCRHCGAWGKQKWVWDLRHYISIFHITENVRKGGLEYRVPGQPRVHLTPSFTFASLVVFRPKLASHHCRCHGVWTN